MIEHINSSNFDNIISNGNVLIDFYAEWCGPCRMLGPVLSDFSSIRSDIKVFKVNVDENEDLARRFGVMSIPCLILFNDGVEADKKIGFMSQDELNDWIK